MTYNKYFSQIFLCLYNIARGWQAKRGILTVLDKSRIGLLELTWTRPSQFKSGMWRTFIEAWWDRIISGYPADIEWTHTNTSHSLSSQPTDLRTNVILMLFQSTHYLIVWCRRASEWHKLCHTQIRTDQLTDPKLDWWSSSPHLRSVRHLLPPRITARSSLVLPHLTISRQNRQIVHQPPRGENFPSCYHQPPPVLEQILPGQASQGPQGGGDSQPGVRCQAQHPTLSALLWRDTSILQLSYLTSRRGLGRILLTILSSETSWPEPCTWIFLPQPDHRSTDGKYLQYLAVFTHEITGTGNIADLCENGSLERFESLKPKKQQHPPAALISSHIFSGLFENLTQTPYQD